ncbi:DUF6894 family protein [Methylorubrum extorquens]|uniref:DUF6894 domain-containing protein n=1 Tax=Methylorubrum extorquens DSM 13060 TaxID=882800 RepID=H1KIA7_METEX|nr:hypothetical protein [Methylorubrum extorquens]EHP92742.1 hypothetical protein MetexDRAFT_2369 [Methylorubrum extorquens DSM 13060]
MPRYFFNVRHRPGPTGLAEDREGDELVDVAAAREHALSEAKAVIARDDRPATIRDWMDCLFEITDGDGQLVLTVPFSDTVQEQDED